MNKISKNEINIWGIDIDVDIDGTQARKHARTYGTRVQ